MANSVGSALFICVGMRTCMYEYINVCIKIKPDHSSHLYFYCASINGHILLLRWFNILLTGFPTFALNSPNLFTQSEPLKIHQILLPCSNCSSGFPHYSRLTAKILTKPWQCSSPSFDLISLLQADLEDTVSSVSEHCIKASITVKTELHEYFVSQCI